MASYAYFGRGAAVPYEAPFRTALQRKLDLPDLIANPGKLALAASPTVPLTSFSGFGAADVLELWEVPAGFALTHVGVRVTTAEGATCLATIGNASATQTHRLAAAAGGYMGTLNLNSATTQAGLIADTHLGGSTYEQVIFVTAGSIDITFSHAATDAVICNIFCNGYMAW
jgi:hypothetical protein